MRLHGLFKQAQCNTHENFCAKKKDYYRCLYIFQQWKQHRLSSVRIVCEAKKGGRKMTTTTATTTTRFNSLARRRRWKKIQLSESWKCNVMCLCRSGKSGTNTHTCTTYVCAWIFVAVCVIVIGTQIGQLAWSWRDVNIQCFNRLLNEANWNFIWSRNNLLEIFVDLKSFLSFLFGLIQKWLEIFVQWLFLIY